MYYVYIEYADGKKEEFISKDPAYIDIVCQGIRFDENMICITVRWFKEK